MWRVRDRAGTGTKEEAGVNEGEEEEGREIGGQKMEGSNVGEEEEEEKKEEDGGMRSGWRFLNMRLWSLKKRKSEMSWVSVIESTGRDRQ